MKSIEIQVNKVEDLFDDFDPSPFLSKDMDDECYDYLLSYTKEIGYRKIKNLIVYLNNNITESQKIYYSESIRNFFKYKLTLLKLKLRTFLKSIGIVFIASSLIMTIFILFASRLEKINAPSFFQFYIKETLLVLSWVSLWKPINMLLFELLPRVNEIQIIRKLSEVKVRFP